MLQPQDSQRSQEKWQRTVGALVDYYSYSLSDWIPARIVDIDAENGAVKVDAKPEKAIDMEEQRRIVRARTRPSLNTLEWIRACLRDGRLEQEADRIFHRHARGIPPSLMQDDMKALSAALDARLGVCGVQVTLREVFRQSNGTVTRAQFVNVVWDLMWGVQKAYGNALVRERSTHMHRDDPRLVYSFQKEIGSGTYGVVNLATCKATGSRRAVKIIPKETSSSPLENVDPEIEHLLALDHPHIVKLYEYYDFGDHVYLVMDFCSGGDLTSAIQKSNPVGLSEDFVADVMHQVLLAIAHVHARGVVHVDLKGSNIMLMPNKGTLPPSKNVPGHTLANPRGRPHAMVIDLGVAQVFRPGDYKNYCPMGTPATMAPEVWWGMVSPKADIFSLGVVMFEMLSSHLPFKCGCDRQESLAYWRTLPQPPWNLPKMKKASDEALQLCRSMLSLDRHKRPAASACLQRRFFTQYLELGEKGRATVPQDLIKRLLQMPCRTVLHKSVALALAQAWPANQLPTIKRVFQTLDEKGTGKLDKDRISKALLELAVDEHDAFEAADAMDLSRDGTVDWTEFVAACLHFDDASLEADLHRIFKEVDEDGDGLLGREDLAKLLAADALRGDAVQDVFNDLAGRSEHTAKVDWTTFLAYFRRQTPRRTSELDFGAGHASPATDREVREAAKASKSGRPEQQIASAGLMDHACGFFSRIQLQFQKQAAEMFQEPRSQQTLQENMKCLEEMGLTDKQKNMAALHRHRNVLNDAVVAELLESRR